jgi:hypothetical protein
MDNLKLYNEVRTVPQTALREIQAGRLKGKSDINPMWRLKTLTEQFGPCGIGWKYVITKQWLEQGAGGEIGAFVNIDLYVKYNEQWSEAIPGTGGSMFVANERNGPYTSDECYKMALTDAISVACKALGFGADVYWNADKTKYGREGSDETPPPKQNKPEPAKNKPVLVTIDQAKVLQAAAIEKYGDNHAQLFAELTGYKKFGAVPATEYEKVLKQIRSDGVA